MKINTNWYLKIIVDYKNKRYSIYLTKGIHTKGFYVKTIYSSQKNFKFLKIKKENHNKFKYIKIKGKKILNLLQNNKINMVIPILKKII